MENIRETEEPSPVSLVINIGEFLKEFIVYCRIYRYLVFIDLETNSIYEKTLKYTINIAKLL